MTIPIAPSRGRGLKPLHAKELEQEKDRPFTGARIETRLRLLRRKRATIAPSRGRGLKQLFEKWAG